MPRPTVEAELNGIVSAHQFLFLLGRTGIGLHRKLPSKPITLIYNALKNAEGYRALTTPAAASRLRSARKACYHFTYAMYHGGLGSRMPNTLEGRHIDDLSEALSARLQVIAEFHFGTPGQDMKQQNEQRINAEVARLAQFDVTANAIMGPAGRTLDNEYRLERATRDHYSAGTVQQWRAATTRLDLQTWVTTVHQWKVEDGFNPAQIAMRGGWNGGTGVQYLDAQQRQAYVHSFQGGAMRDTNNQMAHTGNMSSQTGMGGGWGIYVIDFFNRIYIANHVTNRFHHSSFLSGEPVQAAGEIAINHGRVVGLTNKTGHYKAGPGELLAALNCLSSQGVDLRWLAVSDPFRAGGMWYSGLQAQQAQGVLAGLGPSTTHKPFRVAA